MQPKKLQVHCVAPNHECNSGKLLQLCLSVCQVLFVCFCCPASSIPTLGRCHSLTATFFFPFLPTFCSYFLALTFYLLLNHSNNPLYFSPHPRPEQLTRSKNSPIWRPVCLKSILNIWVNKVKINHFCWGILEKGSFKVSWIKNIFSEGEYLINSFNCY